MASRFTRSQPYCFASMDHSINQRCLWRKILSCGEKFILNPKEINSLDNWYNLGNFEDFSTQFVHFSGKLVLFGENQCKLCYDFCDFCVQNKISARSGLWRQNDGYQIRNSNSMIVVQKYGRLESEWDSIKNATEMLRKFQGFANKVTTSI